MDRRLQGLAGTLIMLDGSPTTLRVEHESIQVKILLRNDGNPHQPTSQEANEGDSTHLDAIKSASFLIWIRYSKVKFVLYSGGVQVTLMNRVYFFC